MNFFLGLDFELDEKALIDDLKKQILEKFRNKEIKSEAEFKKSSTKVILSGKRDVCIAT